MDTSAREKDLCERFIAGDIRALSRILTLVENQTEQGTTIHQKLFAHSGKAHVIGVTGSPGAGKSSLVNELALSFSKSGGKVAVLAVDPSSPYSGGAVLGDRIRMEQAVESHSIFVRSMASRGALGGLSHATADTVDILDAFGFSHILVETVGVGQGEVDIARTAHTTIVVLVPGMGDEVQVMKAGILEIADLFVINKSDRTGIHALERELRILLTLNPTIEKQWEIPIIKTIATKPTGIEELVQSITNHNRWLKTSSHGDQRAHQHMSERIIQLTSRLVIENVRKQYQADIEKSIKDCLERKSDPHSVAKNLFKILNLASSNS